VTKLDVVFTEPDSNAVKCLQEAFTFPQESRGMMKSQVIFVKFWIKRKIKLHLIFRDKGYFCF
jgi:hypothetical protein